jgi:hypothetical protein
MSKSQLLKSTILIVLLVTFTALLAHAGQFVQAPQYPVGSNPEAVAVADFNGDGNLDIAVANSASNSISVLLGKGDGTFGAAVSYATDSTPQGIATGDFNGDGRIDLAVTNSGSNTLSIFLGNGNGTFQSKVDYATGRKPWGIAVGKFGGSGSLDIAVTNATDDTVGIFLGNGSGAFSKQVTYNTGTNPSSVAVGDVNNDGVADLVVANNNDFNTVSVLLGVGNGTFQGDFQYQVAGAPISVALADFNGDGNLDVAVAVAGSQGGQPTNLVSILLGVGNGGFQPHEDYPVGVFPTGLAVGDFNNDGNVDVAVSAGNGNTLTVLWGAGTGTFQGQVAAGTGDTPYAAAAGDFNNDGVTDLVAVNFGENSVSVILSNGKSDTFQDRADYAAGVSPYSITTADFNGDGHLDLAVGNYTAGTVSVEFGNGDGTFQAPNAYPAGSPYALAVGDFNGDKIQDIAVADYTTGTVSILLGIAGGTFQPATTFPVGSEPASIAVGDFNGDGKLDLAVANFHSNTLSVLLGNGNGTFQAAVTYTVGNGPVSVEQADFNGDGVLDLAVVNETDNSVSILLGIGNGTFGKQTTYSTGTGGNPLSLVVGDFNGDAKLDLAVADYQTKEVSVLLGNGDGTFQTVQQYPTGANPSSIVAADFNGDGKLDLALTSTPLGTNPGNLVSLLLGNGDGTFGPPALFGVGYLSYSAVVGDFNGDGAIDLAVANEASNTISVLLNAQGTEIATVAAASPSSYGQSVTFTTTITASVPNGAAPTGTVTLKNGSVVLGSGNLSGGVFALSTSTLPVGADSISVVYSGDTNYQPHTITLTQTVKTAATSVGLVSSPNPSNPNQSVSFTATVAPGTSGQPTGTVNFLDGTTLIGSSPVNSNGVASFSTASLSMGTHNITAAYQGDNHFSASTSQVVSQAVQQGSTSDTLASSANPSFDGQSVTFTATVASGTSTMPTGSVKFGDGNTVIGASTLNASGIATFTISTLAVGTHNITAAYSGDSNFSPANSAALSQVVQQSNSGTVLTSSLNPSAASQTVLFTATVTSSAAVAPTGNVRFMDGATQIGVANLSAGGVATFSTAGLTTGTHSITAVYSGDTNNNADTSNVLSQLVNPAPDFALAAGAFSPSTVAPGSSTASIITINSIGGMDVSKVALTCSISPATTPAAACSVGTVTVANSLGTSTLTVTTTGPSASLNLPMQRNSSGTLLALGLMIPAMLLGGAGFNRSGRRLLSLVLMLLVLSVAGFETACGGGGSKTQTVTGNTGTPAGVYTVTISGSAEGLSHTAPKVSFTVQ